MLTKVVTMLVIAFAIGFLVGSNGAALVINRKIESVCKYNNESFEDQEFD